MATKEVQIRSLPLKANTLELEFSGIVTMKETPDEAIPIH